MGWISVLFAAPPKPLMKWWELPEPRDDWSRGYQPKLQPDGKKLDLDNVPQDFFDELIEDMHREPDCVRGSMGPQEQRPGDFCCFVLSVKPGEVIVIQCEGIVSQHDHDRAVEQMREAWPHNKCVLLDSGQTLAVLRKEDVA